MSRKGERMTEKDWDSMPTGKRAALIAVRLYDEGWRVESHGDGSYLVSSHEKGTLGRVDANFQYLLFHFTDPEGAPTVPNELSERRVVEMLELICR